MNSVLLYSSVITLAVIGVLAHIIVTQRLRKYARKLEERLLRRDLSSLYDEKNPGINNEFELIERYMCKPLLTCLPMQAWLLQAQKMRVDTIAGSMCVTVNRVGVNYKLAATVAGERVSSYGATLGRACENFNDRLTVRQKRQNLKD